MPICTTGANKGTCYQMPVVGQGSCCGAYNIDTWLSAGGIHIDTSCDYGSQPGIAASIAKAGADRSKLWITSKINVESCATNMTQALYDLVLNPLQMTYVDLLLLHHAGRWETDNNPHPPCFDLTKANAQGTYYNCRLQTVQAYEAIVAQGLARTWGVSNWQVRDLEQMYAAYGYYPAINQIECAFPSRGSALALSRARVHAHAHARTHISLARSPQLLSLPAAPADHPWWRESEVVAFCNKHGILVEAYAPVGDGDRSHMRDAPIFAQLAAAHNVTIGQVRGIESRRRREERRWSGRARGTRCSALWRD